MCNIITNFEEILKINESYRLHQIQNVNALMKTIQPKKQQRQQLQQQQLPLVLVLVLLEHVDGLGMDIVMTAQTIWIAILMVEIAVALMSTQTIAQVTSDS